MTRALQCTRVSVYTACASRYVVLVDRGKCQCDEGTAVHTCQCEEGYTGNECECPISQDTCIDPTNPEVVQ